MLAFSETRKCEEKKSLTQKTAEMLGTIRVAVRVVGLSVGVGITGLCPHLANILVLKALESRRVLEVLDGGSHERRCITQVSREKKRTGRAESVQGRAQSTP